MNLEDLNKHRFDLVTEPCGLEREKLYELAVGSHIPSLMEAIMGRREPSERDFVECPDICQGSPAGQYIHWRPVEEVLRALASEAHALNRQIVASAQANSQLAGAVATRDREIAELKTQLQIERGIAERLEARPRTEKLT